ncbi:MAG TPA: hypothetical protein VJQ56_10945 [Blastocatellia bacterium]|nr:hypothetical protein [Blastocatellia bacterium]
MIAVVGGDGAGKSTSIDGLYRWLSGMAETRKIHIGNPPYTLTSLAVAALLKLTRLLAPPSDNNGSSAKRPGTLEMVQWVCNARDRYKLYLKARRLANKGELVLCDRYPLPEIKLMDGPRISQSLASNRGPLARLFYKAERQFYKKILPPDLLIVLRVNPDIAVQRKTGEDPSHVRTRSQEMWDLSWEGDKALVVDANRPKDVVLAELKSIVSSRL